MGRLQVARRYALTSYVLKMMSFVCLEEASSIVWRPVLWVNGRSSMFLNKRFSVSPCLQIADIDYVYRRLC